MPPPFWNWVRLKKSQDVALAVLVKNVRCLLEALTQKTLAKSFSTCMIKLPLGCSTLHFTLYSISQYSTSNVLGKPYTVFWWLLSIYTVKKNNLNLRIKSEPDTVGAVVTVYIRMSDFCWHISGTETGHIPLRLLQPWQASVLYAEIQIIFETV